MNETYLASRQIFIATFLALSVVCLFSLPIPAHAAISITPIHQERFNNDSTAAQTTSNFTPGSNVLLVVAVTFYEAGSQDGNGAPTITLSDSRGLSWTTRLAAEYDSVLSFPSGTRIFTAPAGASASMNLTVDVSQALYQADTWDVQVFEVRGYDANSPIGLTAASGMDMAGTSLALGGTTAASSVTLALGLTDHTATLTITPGSGWSEHYDTYTYPTQAQSQTKSGAISSAAWTAFATGAYSKWAVAVELRAGTAGLQSAALSKPPNSLGLVGYWSFDEGTSTVATDFSGNNKSGTLSTTGVTLPSWVYGKRRSAIEFDGTDDYMSVGNVASNVKTISFWINADDTTSRKIMDIDGTDQIELDGSSQVTATSFPGTTAIYVDGSSASPVVGSGWHHVVITDTTGVSASTVDIGRVAGGYFDGKIDEVRMYSRLLAATEIESMGRAGAGKFSSSVELQRGSSLESGLVGHWTFDGPDITANHIIDRAGQGKHGGFYGSATTTATTLGKLGQALEFNGATSYVNVGNLGNVRSVAFWLNADDLTSREIISMDGAIQIELDGSSAVTATGFTSPTVFVDGSIASTISSGWHHVVVTTGTDVTASTFQIGQAGGNYFDGKLDDVRTYNRELSAAEVRQLYNLGRVMLRN